ncbi:unnamed protein product [Heligmosomoides polygyrus]|uniref:Neuroblastoma-amplified sequence n=1 Tax=Heligmosomoides polygyrus TaxID=6339 RepID=A0A183FMG9_HELPZ|nr:unnamed protein product [Heligmosomoides polygyrus]
MYSTENVIFEEPTLLNDPDTVEFNGLNDLDVSKCDRSLLERLLESIVWLCRSILVALLAQQALLADEHIDFERLDLDIVDMENVDPHKELSMFLALIDDLRSLPAVVQSDETLWLRQCQLIKEIYEALLANDKAALKQLGVVDTAESIFEKIELGMKISDKDITTLLRESMDAGFGEYTWLAENHHELIRTMEHFEWPVEVDEERLLELVQKDPRHRTCELAEKLECSHSTIAQHVRLDACVSFLTLRQNIAWLENLPTDNEEWVVYLIHTRKCQWLSEGEDRQHQDRNFIQKGDAQCLEELRGVIHWELLPANTAVTSDVYCSQLDRVEAALRGKQDKIFLHDNARLCKRDSEKLLCFVWLIIPNFLAGLNEEDLAVCVSKYVGKYQLLKAPRSWVQIIRNCKNVEDLTMELITQFFFSSTKCCTEEFLGALLEDLPAEKKITAIKCIDRFPSCLRDQLLADPDNDASLFAATKRMAEEMRLPCFKKDAVPVIASLCEHSSVSPSGLLSKVFLPLMSTPSKGKAALAISSLIHLDKFRKELSEGTLVVGTIVVLIRQYLFE